MPGSRRRHEQEILFPPLTGVEALNSHVDGATLVVDARLSLNLQALTLEQVVSKRRKLINDVSENMKLELELEMKGEAWQPLLQVAGAREHALHELSAALAAVAGHAPDFYNDDQNLSSAMAAAVEAKGRISQGWVSRWGLLQACPALAARLGSGGEGLGEELNLKDEDLGASGVSLVMLVAQAEA